MWRVPAEGLQGFRNVVSPNEVSFASSAWFIFVLLLIKTTCGKKNTNLNWNVYKKQSVWCVCGGVWCVCVCVCCVVCVCVCACMRILAMAITDGLTQGLSNSISPTPLGLMWVKDMVYVVCVSVCVCFFIHLPSFSPFSCHIFTLPLLLLFPFNCLLRTSVCVFSVPVTPLLFHLPLNLSLARALMTATAPYGFLHISHVFLMRRLMLLLQSDCVSTLRARTHCEAQPLGKV